MFWNIFYHYFIILSWQGAPIAVRGDCGTENVFVAGVQRFLRRDCQEDFAGFKSFMYGTSVANQVCYKYTKFLW